MAILTSTKLSSLLFGNRFDAELYNPQLLISFNEMSNNGFELVPIGKVCLIRSGTTPPDRDDTLNFGPVLFKTTDIRNNVLSPNRDYYHISPVINQRMSSTSIQVNDVLLNIVGATLDVIGRSAFVYEGFREANITQAMVLLRIKKDFKPGFLFAYLNTKYAQDQIKRYARPTGQFNLNLMEVGKIVVPKLDEDIQTQIDNIIKQCAIYQEESIANYNKAVNILSEELQLDKLELPHTNWFTANYSEAVEAKRIDSNHFREEYSYLFNYLNSRFNCKELGQIVSLNRRGLQPKYIEDGDIMVVNSKHLSPTHINYEQTERTTKEEFTKQQAAHIKNGDVLIYTTGAYVGLTNCFNSNEDALASNHVNILRLSDKTIDPNYLALVFNSIIGKLQTQKYSRGSAQLELYPADIASFIIPIIDKVKMREIGDLIRKSLTSLNEYKSLLVKAKISVEKIIEDTAEPNPECVCTIINN